MAIRVGTRLRAMGEEEFREVVYAAMEHVFAVHNEMGRLFEERIYKREIARRIGDVEWEVPIQVEFEDFVKTYYLDLLVGGGAIFEFKAVEEIGARHRAQLLHYLFLADLPHGKLVNMGSERVQHEFVNAPVRRCDRTEFVVEDHDWKEIEGFHLREKMVAFLCDVGTGLDAGLYQEVASHFCGRAAAPESEMEIRLDGVSLGTQAVRLASPDSVLRVTSLSSDRHNDFEAHLRQFLACTPLRSLHWINITRSHVQFKTLAP